MFYSEGVWKVNYTLRREESLPDIIFEEIVDEIYSVPSGKEEIKEMALLHKKPNVTGEVSWPKPWHIETECFLCGHFKRGYPFQYGVIIRIERIDHE